MAGRGLRLPDAENYVVMEAERVLGIVLGTLLWTDQLKTGERIAVTI